MNRRWVHHGKRRYYAVYVQQDLFRDWVVTRVWGSLDTDRGQVRHEVFRSETAALEAIESIDRRRLRRGYLPCAQRPHFDL